MGVTDGQLKIILGIISLIVWSLYLEHLNKYKDQGKQKRGKKAFLSKYEREKCCFNLFVWYLV